MLLTSLLVPVVATAADATVFALKGQARIKRGGSFNLLAVGNNIGNGAFIQVAKKANLGVKLPDGGTVYFSEGSAVRLKFAVESVVGVGGAAGSTEVTLVGGSLAGDFSNSSVVVRTPAGVVDLSRAVGRVSFSPSSTGAGSLSVAASSGQVSVTATGSDVPVSVAAGRSYTLDGAATGPVAMNAAQVASVASAASGDAGALSQASGVVLSDAAGRRSNQSVPVQIPDVAILSATQVFSPNGEGATN